MFVDASVGAEQNCEETWCRECCVGLTARRAASRKDDVFLECEGNEVCHYAGNWGGTTGGWCRDVSASCVRPGS